MFGSLIRYNSLQAIVCFAYPYNYPMNMEERKVCQY